MARTAASLEALLAHAIDYAGLYPPAALPLSTVLENYRRYRESSDGWLLNRLVLPLSKLLEAQPGDRWRISLVTDDEPGPLPPQVETLETKLARRIGLPTYCEAPLDRIGGAFAKIRTGGLTPEAIPPSQELADFLAEAAARRVPFKATAGLHHPFRSLHPLTYAPDSPRAAMHGFVNVFTAAAFAWHGLERQALLEILNDEDPRAFDFSDAKLRWRGQALSTTQIAAARRQFAHSFGSCSFEEPISELRKLELLP